MVMFAWFGTKFGAGGGNAGACFGAGDCGGCIGGGCREVTNGRTPTGHHGATGRCHQEKARHWCHQTRKVEQGVGAGVLLLADRCCLLRNLCNKQNI